jgi:hypothetical protein
MSLIMGAWKNSRNDIDKKTVNQLLVMCGNGKLIDDSETSIEFREFLSIIPSSYLKKYSIECLSDEIDTKVKGLVLQDLVNEIGSRIGFNVVSGRYRGSTNIEKIGYDGLWETSSQISLIVEIKTSSTYNINLNTVGNYKKQLIQQEKCIEEKSSILLIVGRFDTEAWESQIRGSIRCWDTRIISVEGLIRLLEIKESIDEPEVFEKISNILTPQEYTKVDGIIDIVFSTTEDVRSEVNELSGDVGEMEDKKIHEQTNEITREQCIKRISTHLDCNLIKDSRTCYIDSENNIGVVCLVSREYREESFRGYWFSFHPHQKEMLLNCKNGYLGLGCGSEQSIILIPIKNLIVWFDKIRMTHKDKRSYYHLSLKIRNNNVSIDTLKEFEPISISEYLI